MTKTKSGPSRVKKAWGALAFTEQLMAVHGIDPADPEALDKLNEKLENLDTEVVSAGEPGISVVTAEPAIPSEDPLGWITDKTPFVRFVSSTSSFVLRQKNKQYVPPMTRVTMRNIGSGPWAACPFKIEGKNHIHTQNLLVFYESWWYHQLTRQKAEAVFSDSRIPRPTEAVIDPSKFHGWDRRAKMAGGDYEPLAEFIPLRELTRRVLQKANNTFLDWLTRPKGFDFDRRIPNPYRNRLTDVTPMFKTDREFQK